MRMQRTAVKRISPWSVFKFSAVLYLILFLIFFLFFLLGYLITIGSGMLGSQGKEAANAIGAIGLGGGVGLVVFFFIGLFSSVLYAVVNAIGALLYNIIAWMTGGLS